MFHLEFEFFSLLVSMSTHANWLDRFVIATLHFHRVINLERAAHIATALWLGLRFLNSELYYLCTTNLYLSNASLLGLEAGP